MNLIVIALIVSTLQCTLQAFVTSKFHEIGLLGNEPDPIKPMLSDLQERYLLDNDVDTPHYDTDALRSRKKTPGLMIGRIKMNEYNVLVNGIMKSQKTTLNKLKKKGFKLKDAKKKLNRNDRYKNIYDIDIDWNKIKKMIS